MYNRCLPRFFGFGQFLYRPKVSANFQFRFRYGSLNQKGGFGRTLSKTLLFFSFGTFVSFQAEIECLMHVVVLPKQHMNQFCKADNRCKELTALIYTL